MTKIIRTLLCISGTVLLLLFSAAAVSHIVNIGNIIGITAAVILIFTGIFYEWLAVLVHTVRKNKKGRIAFDAVAGGAGTLLLCFLIALSSVCAYSTPNADNQKIVIVLGCAVRGNTPSVMLRQRINAAYDFLEKNPDSAAILSGGQGNGENISEAECMYNVLTDMGIDGTRLFLEDRSTDTDENITFSKKIIDDNNLEGDVAIASSDFHLKRAVMVAKKQGIDAKRITSKTDSYLAPTYYVRDTLGVILEFLVK